MSLTWGPLHFIVELWFFLWYKRYEVLHMKQKKNKKRWIYNIAILFFLGVMIFSLWNLIPLLIQDHRDNETQKEMVQMVEKKQEDDKTVVLEPDWKKLQESNPDIIGWIYVPDTVINYPIVQSKDNSYYLNHSSLKDVNTIGAIFLDFNASSDLSDFHSIIYGHSVINSSAMFSQIKEFCDEDFFKEHPYLYLLTPEQNYRCDIVALTKTTSESFLYQIGFSGAEDQEAFLERMMSEASLSRETDDLSADDSIVTLSTCDIAYGLDSDKRILLHARLVPWDETILYEES